MRLVNDDKWSKFIDGILDVGNAHTYSSFYAIALLDDY